MSVAPSAPAGKSVGPRTSQKQMGFPGRAESPGIPTTGCVVRLAVGHSHGFIRLHDGREVYFHRTDLPWGAFNGLRVGDQVTFDLLDDRLSGPRALRVVRHVSDA